MIELNEEIVERLLKSDGVCIIYDQSQCVYGESVISESMNGLNNQLFESCDEIIITEDDGEI